MIKVAGNIDYTSLKMSRPQLGIGDANTVVGYPQGRDLSLLFGVVSSMNGPGGTITISTPIEPGQAGSPVLNKNGDVVAVVTRMYSDAVGGIATPIQLFKAMLALAAAE